MTPDAFRKLALAIPGAVEGGHMGHADFRREGKIFATLGSPTAAHAMIKLSPEEQTVVVAAEPATFAPASGAWGRAGSTIVDLAKARKTSLEPALHLAWEAAAPKPRVRSKKKA